MKSAWRTTLMAAPLVTIAIPTYNRAGNYFPEALQGALSQTYPNLDILVSDNCSSDATQEVIRRIADPRLRYVRHEQNIGQKNNYSFCFQQARGSYVLLLHDDDRIDEDFVSSCMEAAGGTDTAGIIRTGVRRIDGDGTVIDEVVNDVVGRSLEDFFHGWFKGQTAIYCCNTLFNSEKLHAIGGFQSRHFCYADTIAIFTLAARHRRIDIPDVKASFRIHAGEGGFSRRLTEWCEDSLELLQLMAELAPQHREQILREGGRFFSKANYHRAAAGATPWLRLAGIIKVMKFFGFRYLPRANVFLHLLEGTALYNGLRTVKKRLQYGFSGRLVSSGDA